MPPRQRWRMGHRQRPASSSPRDQPGLNDHAVRVKPAHVPTVEQAVIVDRAIFQCLTQFTFAVAGCAEDAPLLVDTTNRATFTPAQLVDDGSASM